MTINDISGLATQLANLQHQINGKATLYHHHAMPNIITYSTPAATNDKVGGIKVSPSDQYRQLDSDGNEMPNDFNVILYEDKIGELNTAKVHIDYATTELPGIVKSKKTKTNTGDNWDIEVHESGSNEGTMWVRALYVDESGNNGIFKSEDYVKYKELLEEFDKLKLRVESAETQIELIEQKITSLESTLSSLDARISALESAGEEETTE